MARGIRYLPVAAMAAIGFLLAGMAGCGREPAATAPPAAPAVTVAKPELKQITDYDEFTGRVQAVESVDIRPRVSGFIDYIGFTDGQVVKKGDLLFRIDPRPFQIELEKAQSDMARDSAKLRIAELELERFKAMKAENATSQQELDTAQGKRDEAKGAVQTAQASIDRAKLDLDYSEIKAPVAGKVSRPMITVGNLVSAGSTSNNVLTTIVSVDPMYVYFDVDEQSLLKYQAAARASGAAPGSVREAKLPVLLSLAGERDATHPGMVDFVDNQVNPNTGTISARAVLENKNRVLTPGLFARVQLRMSEPHDALMVPDRAVASDQGRSYLLTVDAQNRVQYRPVELGITTNGMRVVKSGLTKDDWVVVNGIQRARPGVTVEPRKENETPPASQPVRSAAL